MDHRELVLRCLTDDDITIRTRALELLAGIVSRKSLVDLVHHLLEHVKHSEGDQHTLSTQPLNTPDQHTLSTHLINTPDQHTLSI